MKVVRNIVIAAACAGGLGLAVTAAIAQQQGGVAELMQAHRGGEGNHGWGHRRGGMDMVCGDSRDSHLALAVGLVDTFIALTPEQDTAWRALAQAAVAASNRIGAACEEIERLGEASTIPERLERLELMMVAGVDVLQDLRPEIEAFYDTLNEEQQRMLDMLASRGRRH